MGITFLGHTESFNEWVFDINGKRFVATNKSTANPLRIRFNGVYSTQPLNLIKTSGFDILSSTATGAEWVWQGTRYKTWWLVTEDPDEAFVELAIGDRSPVPYEGPAGGAVGTGVVSNAVIQAQQENTGPSGSGYKTPVQPSGGTTTQTRDEAPREKLAAKSSALPLPLLLGAAYLLLS